MASEWGDNGVSLDDLSLKAVLDDLDLSAVRCGDDWTCLQRSNFDSVILGEPYHSVQLIIDKKNKRFLSRVWSHTKDKGHFSDFTELTSICRKVFKRTRACAGHHQLLRPPAQDSDAFLVLRYPFLRVISRCCELTCIDESGDTDLPGLCNSCRTLAPVLVGKGQPPSADDADVKSETVTTSMKEEQEEEEDDDEAGNDPTLFLSIEEDQVSDEDASSEGNFKKSDDGDISSNSSGPGNEKKLLPCHHVGCEKVYHNDRSLIVHLKNHHLFGPFECTLCPSSSSRFTCQYAQDLFQHTVVSHSGTLFRCPACREKGFAASELDHFCQHYLECWRLKRRQSHPKSKPKENKHQCEMCGKTFPKERLLIEHRNWHKGLKPLRCDECDFATCYLSSLYSHSHKHLREKGVEVTDRSVRLVYKCDQCDKTFGRPSVLRQHKRAVHDGVKETRRCSFCPLVFSNKSQWRRHTLKEHSKAPRFPCPLCQVHCIDKYELRIHMRVHKDPEFICKFCGKAVKSKQSLLAHERCHTGESPFRCEYCDYKCKARSVLCKHKAVKHKQVESANAPVQ